MAQIDTGKIAYCKIYPGVGIARIGTQIAFAQIGGCKQGRAAR